MPPTILHLHIPRAAGSTVYRHLARAARIRPITRADRRTDVQQLLESKGELALISGHFYWGLHEFLKDYVYFIPLREPVSRVGSVYDYLRKNPRHKGYSYYSTTPLVDVLKRINTAATQFSNGHVRQLIGSVGSPIKMEREHFDAAWANLCRPDVLVCFSDDLNRGFEALAARTERAIPPCDLSINATERTPFDDLLTEAIRRLNRWDIELYERARERFG